MQEEQIFNQNNFHSADEWSSYLLFIIEPSVKNCQNLLSNMYIPNVLGNLDCRTMD
jgi:hypothetical protein